MHGFLQEKNDVLHNIANHLMVLNIILIKKNIKMKRRINGSWFSRLFLRHPKIPPLLIVSFLMGFGTQSFVFKASNKTVTPIAIQTKEFACNVCFTPNQSCLPMIINEINNAKKSIRMQAYSLTSKPIAHALTRAKERGISIIIIADKSQKRERHTQINALRDAGIPIYIDHKPAIAHNKIIIIDGITVIGGSYNFSNAAERRNAENVTIIKNKEFAALYSVNFEQRLTVSARHTHH